MPSNQAGPKSFRASLPLLLIMAILSLAPAAEATAQTAAPTQAMSAEDNSPRLRERNHITNFRDAKRALPLIFSRLKEPVSIYCGCTIHFTFKNGRVGYLPDLEECGYETLSGTERAYRFEAEHIVPASSFGRQMRCWMDAGRSNCSQKDPFFMMMEGDLHNLYPVIGEVNADRGNFKFGDWNDERLSYGTCPTVIDSARRRIQPRVGSRGIIARAGLYMHEKYSLSFDRDQLRLFQKWHYLHPADENECKRNELIAFLTGGRNRFVTESCQSQGINGELSAADKNALLQFLKRHGL